MLYDFQFTKYNGGMLYVFPSGSRSRTRAKITRGEITERERFLLFCKSRPVFHRNKNLGRTHEFLPLHGSIYSLFSLVVKVENCSFLKPDSTRHAGNIFIAIPNESENYVGNEKQRRHANLGSQEMRAGRMIFYGLTRTFLLVD